MPDLSREIVPEHANVYSYFERSVRMWPDRCALDTDDATYTYRQLEEQVDRLIPPLMESRSRFVGLFARKSLTAYAGILSILKAGRAWVPFNPTQPAERSLAIRRTVGITTLIADHAHLKELTSFLTRSTVPLTVLLPETSRKQGEDLIGRWQHRLLFKEDLAAMRAPSADLRSEPYRYAYLLFTSGSTGEPKGVLVSHRNLSAFIDSINGMYDFSENDRFSQAFELTFDPSVQDMFSAWSNGAALCCLPSRATFLPTRFIAEKGITVWHSVPSVPRLMKLYRQFKPGMYPALRYSMFGGEPLHVDLAREWSRAAPGSVIDNLYGPTEITITISRYRWEPEVTSEPKSRNGIMSIGRVFPGHIFKLLCREGRGQADRGELLISGEQVVDSYFRNVKATQAQFVRSQVPNRQVWYRTGDLVERDEEGDLYFISRVDDQVKIRGNRIEPGEIVHRVESLTGPETARILPYPYKRSYSERLILFLLESVTACDDEILQYCEQNLIDYMVPQEICRVPRFPLGKHDKIDNQKLIAIYEERANEQQLGNRKPA